MMSDRAMWFTAYRCGCVHFDDEYPADECPVHEVGLQFGHDAYGGVKAPERTTMPTWWPRGLSDMDEQTAAMNAQLGR